MSKGSAVGGKTPGAVMYGMTDTGRRRKNNEDSFIVMMDLGVCGVADGMGGAAAGETASRLFTEHAAQVFSDGFRHKEDDAGELIQKAFSQANKAIIGHAADHPGSVGMGCTGEILVISDGQYIIGHVGDSRVYLFSAGVLTQLTHDHSLVQLQIDQGLLKPEDAGNHPLRNVILQAVGTEETLSVDLIRGTAYPNDIFLLCSDGLTSMVGDSDIAQVLSSDDVLPRKVERLIEAANSNGGLDNITVVLAQKTESKIY